MKRMALFFILSWAAVGGMVVAWLVYFVLKLKKTKNDDDDDDEIPISFNP